METPAADTAQQTLPTLPEASGWEILLSVTWITAAALLLSAVALRVILQVDLLQWWVPVALVAGVAVADFLSGLVHWTADTWGRADMPLVGARVLVPFRVHHSNPDDFLRRSFVDTNGDVAAVTLPAIAALLAIPDTVGWSGPALVFGLACCTAGIMTNQIHQWAHMPRPPAPVRLFQAAHVVLSPRGHSRHHARPYDGHYCITTGWCNGPLEAIAFFPRLERIVSRLTGACPRADERDAESRLQGGGGR